MLTGNPAVRAEQHIQEIRKSFDLATLGPSTSRHVTNLECALNLLSDQLYQKPTHFLLELIQNADDNDYQVANPTVTFTYNKSRLRIDCNETGFSRANVEAICQIGQSTKAGKTGSTRYVGEKGIGFKSVFKVSNKVWISSNGYAFKFDKSQPLGMIAPIWEPFPEPIIPGLTSILLELSPSYDQTKLVTELKGLDTRLLIFLQKLREINIRINMTGCKPWSTSLRKSEKVTGSESTTMLTQDSKIFEYRISKHTATDMPPDPKREGQEMSQILLAFPKVETPKDDLERQQVYAFLPIRDHGFKFLLQGDFLLSASREDILSDSPWNKALRDCFVDAFVTVIKASHERFLRYDWPLFLPIDDSPPDFFESARLSIMQRLTMDATVRNSLGKSLVPRDLIRIPEQFRTKAGSPLLAFNNTLGLFLSDQYGEHCNTPLKKLGVRKMELNEFVETLREVLRIDSDEFYKKPSDWHSEFARNLLAELWKSDADRSQWKTVQELPIIPLEKDQWISPAKAAEVGVFLPPDSEDELQLDGLEIKLVKKEAALNQSQASLYRYLDVPTINKLEICQYIANSLCRESSPPRSISSDKLVSQTIFLFEAGWRNPSGLDMWFQTQAGGFDRGSRLYVKSRLKYSTSHYFSSIDEIFLNGRYLYEIRKMSIDIDEFESWLEDCMYVWKIPRLLTVIATRDVSPRVEISWEFSRLAQTVRSPSWIYLLRDNFRKYSTYFDLEEVLKHKLYARKLGQRTKIIEEEHRIFLESIGRLKVKCIGNETAELKEAYLPQPGLREDTNGRVPLVDILDPEHENWQYLKRFGLGIVPDLKMYLQCLEKLSLIPSTRLDRSWVDRKVTRYLDQIQARCMEDVVMVKDQFTSKAIIRVSPVSSESDYRWVRSINCLWDGGSCFRILPILRRQYPGNELLFNKILGRREAKLQDLYTEAISFRLGNDLEHITEIFCEIENRLRDEETDPSNYFGRLASNDIFPILSGEAVSDSKGGYDKLCNVQPKVEWFIADRQNLHQSFKNLIPLLAFRVEIIQALKKTMDRMKLDRYRLSRCAQSRAETYGVSNFDQKLTQDMLNRIPYLLSNDLMSYVTIRLIPTMTPIKTKRRIARHLRSLKVFLTDRLTQEWSVMIGSEIVQGRPYQANVVFVTEKESTLHIFLSRKYLARSICKNEIVQRFADFCEIRDNVHLLNIALWESLDEVKTTFQEYGIPEYDPLIDSNEPRDEKDENDDNVESVTSDLNGDDVQHIVNSEEFEGKSTHDNRQVNINEVANGSTPSNHEENVQVVCSHCARGNVRFAAVGVRSIFVTREHEGGKGQMMQLPNSQSRPSKAFLGLARILGRNTSQKASDSRIGSPVRNDDFDLQYKGEYFFSTILTQFLGDTYKPNEHWTSISRARAGHKSFQGSSATHATFTLPDRAGTVTAVMLREHPDLARLWTTQPPTWHFEVRTTAGELSTPFYLTNAQVDRARAFSTTSLSEASQIPKDISVLVRVFNTNTADGPEANLYRDPWEMFLSGDITIKADTWYQCGVRQELEGQGTAGSATSPSSNGTNGQADNLKPPPPYSSEKDTTTANFDQK